MKDLERLESRGTLQSIVSEAVNCLLESDVGLGTLLSGGIDSSIVTILANSENTLPSYTLGFKNNRLYDESYRAKNLAEQLKIESNIIYQQSLENTDSIEAVLDIFTEPFGDSSILSLNALLSGIPDETKFYLGEMVLMNFLVDMRNTKQLEYATHGLKGA